jgi:hypothetical protein
MTIAMTPALHVLDWFGSGVGLLGAYLLAFRLSISRFGWIAFFAANITYIAMASQMGVLGLLAQQVGFMGSSAIGIYWHFVARSNERCKSDAQDARREFALTISARLAQVPLHDLGAAAGDLAVLIREAKTLHLEAPATPHAVNPHIERSTAGR